MIVTAVACREMLQHCREAILYHILHLLTPLLVGLGKSRHMVTSAFTSSLTMWKNKGLMSKHNQVFHMSPLNLHFAEEEGNLVSDKLLYSHHIHNHNL